jgi:hypothetical protein
LQRPADADRRGGGRQPAHARSIEPLALRRGWRPLYREVLLGAPPGVGG